MKTAVCKLKSVTPYSQSRCHETPKLERELPDAYEERTWREKAHFDESGQIFIPPMCFKKSLDAAVQMRGDKIPGKRNATWTKHFKSGVLVTDPVFIGVTKDAVARGRYHCDANGKPGGTRVWRILPEVPKWEAEVTFYVLDDTITESVFTEHLKHAGNFIGVGRFRPANGGFFGRFTVEKVSWKNGG